MSYIILVILLIIAFLFIYINSKIRRFSRQVFGTETLGEGLAKDKLERSLRPRSLQSMEPVYLPRIKKDFPELNIEELKTRGEGILLSQLRSLASQDIDKLVTYADKEIRTDTLTKIQDLRDNRTELVFKDLKIHKSVVSDYKKDQGQVWITLQTGLQGIIYSLREGRLETGEDSMLSQKVYRLSYLYVQDPDKVKDKEVLGLNCPNCGAPIRSLGNKVCDFCGSGISEVNYKVWRLMDIRKI